MMKLWFLIQYLFSSTNLDRVISSNKLHIRYNNCLLF
ncbi:hypothetical protein DBR06_SOUSAS36710001, partial [Sousa chinensis]